MVRESRPVPKQSWVNDNDVDSNPYAKVYTNDGDRKRKGCVSQKVSARKRTKKAYSSSYDLVGDLHSRLTKEDVRRIFETANISVNEYEFLVPSKSQRADRPPKGYISVYEDQINAGLRFPLHDMIVKVCNLIKVSPSQLAPNAYRVIVGFILCAKFYEIPVTEASFFSLVKVMSVKGFFTFYPIGGNNFLEDKPLSHGLWKKKFFFLRRKDNSWNCITKWSETFSRPTTDALLADAAIKKGIMNHRFRINELTSKEILLHGGIEPGVPSPEFTFRFLMHKAAVTKFDLLPEDEPPASASAGKIHTIRLKKNSSMSTTPLAAPTNPPTVTASAASLAQPRDEQLVNHQQLQSTPNDTEIPPATETPICEHLPASSEDNLHLHDPQCKEKKSRESGFHEGREEANATMSESDEAEHQPIPPGLRTLWQSIESKYMPKDRYQELEKYVEELSSELTSTKCQIQELKQEVELSEARNVEYENRSSAAHEAMKIQSDLVRIRDSELAYKESRIQALERELKVSEAKRAESEKQACLATENMKNIERKARDIHRILDSDLESTKSQIQKLERQLELSERKRVDSEKKICLANEDKKNLEKMIKDIQSDLNIIRDSELACKESEIQKFVLQLEVSEAKRVDSEKKIHLANEDIKKIEKRTENIHKILELKLESTKLRIQELKRELEKLTYFAYEEKENLEKRLENSQKIHDSELAHAKFHIQELEQALAVSETKSVESAKKIDLANEDKKNFEKMIEYERNRVKDAVEEFKSSDEFLIMVQEKAFEVFDSKHLSIY